LGVCGGRGGDVGRRRWVVLEMGRFSTLQVGCGFGWGEILLCAWVELLKNIWNGDVFCVQSGLMYILV